MGIFNSYVSLPEGNRDYNEIAKNEVVKFRLISPGLGAINTLGYI